MDQQTAEALNKNVWELERQVTDRKVTARGRQMLLRAYARQLEFAEATMGLPEENRGYILPHEESRDGILLIHDDTGKPSDFKAIATDMHKSGYNVYVLRLPLLLPGRDSLEASSWQGCLLDLENRFRMLTNCCRNVYVMGHGFGATLAMQLSAKPRPKALILTSPALFPRENLLQRIISFLHLDRLEIFGGDRGWKGELREAMSGARKQKWWYSTPLYFGAAKDDSSLDTRGISFVKSRASHHRTSMDIRDSGGHDFFAGSSSSEFSKKLLEFINKN